MPGQYFSQFKAISGDWIIASLASSILDKFFSLVDSESHILNTISALAQFTTLTFITHELLYTTGFRKSNQAVQSTWLLDQVMWHMSPNAISKLTNSYDYFHKYIFGTTLKITSE